MTPGFTVASPDERTLGAIEYLAGSAELALMLAGAGYAAYRLRRLALPGWWGAPARLCELVLALAALLWGSQALGSFGAFGRWEMIGACVGMALVAALVCGAIERRRSPRVATAPPAPAVGAVAKVAAVAACAVVAAAWAVPTLGALAAGMDRADTLWYHMPLSARFFQTGSLSELFYFDPIFFASFYPANSEALHAIPLLAFERDALSPLLNLGFLALGLLASWCIGRPYGLAPHALLGGAIALGSQSLVEFQAGEALNDVVGVAFVLAAAAILVNGYAARGLPALGEPASDDDRRPLDAPSDGRLVTGRAIAAGALASAGIAAGLAAGTKLSFLAPAAVLTLAVVAIAPAGRRLRVTSWWTLPLLAAGGYWYVRNLVTVGNPIPYVGSIGPIELIAPERDFQLRPAFSVAHYWDQPAIWVDWFLPDLEESFGPLFPLALLGMVGGSAYAAWRGREPILRWLGVMVLVTVVAYLFTPLTAAGEEGEPLAFVWNIRYLAPALAVGLALLPCLPALRGTPRRRAATLAVLAAVLVATEAGLIQWTQGHIKGAIGTAVLIVAAAAVIAWLWSRGHLGPAARPRVVALMVVGVVLGGLAAGYWQQDHYLERRYRNTSPRLGLAEAIRWPRDLRDARIAVGGVRGVFNQYVFYGTDLSNHVQWLGEVGDDRAFLRIPTCERWRQALNEGGYTHAVTTYDPFDPNSLTDTKEGLWTRRDPASREVLRRGAVSIFELQGELDPQACGDLPDLTPPELDGRSVNAQPSANQPYPRDLAATRSDPLSGDPDDIR